MKRFLAVFLMLAILLTSVSLTAMAADADGWKKADGGWQYIQGGKPVAEKWIQDGGYWYYIAYDTFMVADDFVLTFDKFDEMTGIYYMQENGQMLASAWHERKRVRVEDGVESTYSQWIYAKADGKLAENEWQLIGGKWFFFDGISMLSDGFYEIDGKDYYFKSSGEMLVGWLQPWKGVDGIGDEWIYADKSGELASRWKLIDGKWYFFGNWDGWGLLYYDDVFGIWKDDKTIDIYAADKNGAMITNAWYDDKTQMEDGSVEHTWFYLTGNGLAAKGWLNQNGKWFYMDPDWASMWTGWATIKGINYHFDETSGVMTVGWYKSNGDWYYFKDSGAMASNEWLQINGKWYFFDVDGRMLSGGTWTLSDKKEYTFDANGVWVK